ncbi:MAG: hypothetical protein WC675_01110 [Patescibacteria group bacterium]|jgi:hypothetical protein
MPKNIAYTSIRYIIIDLIGDILYWPVWWYSKGLAKVGLGCLQEIKNQAEVLGIAVWIKNLFTPMFGQYDIEGRIISFFARLIQIIVRSILLLFWIILILILFLAWIFLPVLVGYEIVVNFLWFFS